MNVSKSFHAFDEHARITGNATSQSILAFMYSTGLQEVVPVDQAKALLFYTFAALGGDQNAEMALGYRYWSGIGVSEDCMMALDWYESAAEKGMYWLALIAHILNSRQTLQPWRISNLDHLVDAHFHPHR